MKPKMWLFEKINKIDKSLARMIEKKKSRMHNYQYQQWKRSCHYRTYSYLKDKGITVTIYANKVHSLDEMERFIERHHLPKLTQK